MWDPLSRIGQGSGGNKGRSDVHWSHHRSSGQCCSAQLHEASPRYSGTQDLFLKSEAAAIAVSPDCGEPALPKRRQGNGSPADRHRHNVKANASKRRATRKRLANKAVIDRTTSATSLAEAATESRGCVVADIGSAIEAMEASLTRHLSEGRSRLRSRVVAIPVTVFAANYAY